jgi:hypothetical protein
MSKNESVPDILERELSAVIQEWLGHVENRSDLTCIPLTFEERIGSHFHLLRDVIARLRMDDGTKPPISKAAAIHGDLRRKQGYTLAMAVEESHLLQASIFSMLHKHVKGLDFNSLLPYMVCIEDEAEAQLKQQVLQFAVPALLSTPVENSVARL